MQEAIDLVKIRITQSDGNKPQVIDFRSGQGAGMKMMMKGVAKNMYFEWWMDADRPRETIPVPAGSFEGALRVEAQVSLGTHVWLARPATGPTCSRTHGSRARARHRPMSRCEACNCVQS